MYVGFEVHAEERFILFRDILRIQLVINARCHLGQTVRAVVNCFEMHDSIV